jgi:tetratricopeptide (TPR) repeat protein
MKPLAGRMWWSFYESDADFENFMIRALCYVSGESEEMVRALPWPEREARLLRHLDEEPYLFVLDGLERILVAYHRMDASYLADDEYDEQTANHVTGAIGLPASAAKSFVGQHRLRQTTDLRAGAFLLKLASIDKSRIVITSRLYPTALQVSTGAHRPGCIAYFLRGLSHDDALDLWRALGVAGSRAELLPIFRSVEGHPLLVQTLASEVANYKKAPGDWAQWRVDHPQFDPASLPLVQSRTHILRFALEGLSEKVRKVLHTLVGFRMPASYATLEALLVGPDKACGTAQDLDRALVELEDRGLIGWDRAANRYDAHPIVRGVVWQITDAKDRRAVYAALEAHFEPMATPDSRAVETLADLAPAIERYHTLVGLERYDDAALLFRDRLRDATLYRLAAHRERIAWLEQLFPHGVAELPALSDNTARGYTFNELAMSYVCVGQPGRAFPLYRKAFEFCQQIHDERGLQVVLANISDALFVAGALCEAERSLRRALILNRSSDDLVQEAVTLHFLGIALSLEHSASYGCAVLNRSALIIASQGDLQFEGVVSASVAESWIKLGNFAKASACAERAWQLAVHAKAERDFIRAALAQGEVALARSDHARADERLHHALTRARTVNVVEFELPALIAIARFELARNHPAEARSRLDDVWEAAERGPFPLLQADAYNVLADIAQVEGDTPAAVDAATKAYRAAWCDGPPYAYHWGLVKAKAHLAALGAPEPDMPPFDASRFEPMPEVEINPKDDYWVDPNKLE